jgi:hypothetical protein
MSYRRVCEVIAAENLFVQCRQKIIINSCFRGRSPERRVSGQVVAIEYKSVVFREVEPA